MQRLPMSITKARLYCFPGEISYLNPAHFPHPRRQQMRY